MMHKEDHTLAIIFQMYNLEDKTTSISKDYNVMINGEKLFDQPVKDNKVIYENIIKIATGQGDDYTAGCLLDYSYFKDRYRMAAVDLSKPQALDADPRSN